MMRRLLLWLLHWLIVRLDGDLREQLEQYNEKKKFLEAQERGSLEAIKELDSELTRVAALRAQTKTDIERGTQELKQLQDELRRIDNEKSIAQNELARRSDGDVLRGNL